jgi:hypothetical protein
LLAYPLILNQFLPLLTEHVDCEVLRRLFGRLSIKPVLAAWFSRCQIEAIEARLGTNLDALRVTIAEVADDSIALGRVYTRDMTGASLHAIPTGDALLSVNLNIPHLGVNGKCLDGTRSNAWRVFTLGTEMSYLDSWERHEYPDTGRFRPDHTLMLETTYNLASSAATALGVVPHNPEWLRDVQPYSLNLIS